MRCLLFICLLFGALPTLALDRLQAQGYLLPNGLQVLLKPGYEKGHVSIRLVIGVGFDDFACKSKELPHLLEHLMFSGVDEGGEGGLEERMQALGGDWNAFTSNADTTFVIEAPARNQRKVLDLLMEVLTRTELTQERLDTVRRIVAREDGGHTSRLQKLIDQRDPSHSASNQLASEMGLKCAARPEVDDIPLEALQEALATWYAANNMTLIVVGDLDKLLPGYVQRVYGRLAATEPVERRALASAAHPAEKRRTLARGMLGENARLHLIFREPALANQHDETWELVKANLEWALYSELRLKRGLSYGPSVERELFGDTGLMSLVVDVDRNDLGQAEQVIDALLVQLRRDGFQADSFTRLKQVAIDRQAWAVQGNSALADYYWGALNDYEDGRFSDPAKRIRAVSLESTNQALRQLLEQPGYTRIQQPRFSYDDLYWLAVGALWLVVALLAGWWWYRYGRKPK